MTYDDEDLDYFEVMAVADLPQSRPTRADCMGVNFTGQVRSFYGLGKPCCWYHDRDWTAISEAAISLVEEASRARMASAMEVYRFARPKIVKLGFPRQDAHALYELLSPAIALMVGPAALIYHNGQHRGQAMKDLGVKRTAQVEPAVSPWVVTVHDSRAIAGS